MFTGVSVALLVVAPFAAVTLFYPFVVDACSRVVTLSKDPIELLAQDLELRRVEQRAAADETIALVLLPAGLCAFGRRDKALPGDAA